MESSWFAQPAFGAKAPVNQNDDKWMYLPIHAAIPRTKLVSVLPLPVVCQM